MGKVYGGLEFGICRKWSRKSSIYLVRVSGLVFRFVEVFRGSIFVKFF